MQIRDVSEEDARVIRSRAAAEGRSVSEYLRREIARIASMPTRAELIERIEMRGRVDVPSAVEAIEAERRNRP